MTGSFRVDGFTWGLWGLKLLLLGWVVAQVARAARWAWWTPRKLEKALRRQGISGTPYRLLFGDFREGARLIKEAKLRPMPSLSHDITARIAPFQHRAMEAHEKTSTSALGPFPPFQSLTIIHQWTTYVHNVLHDSEDAGKVHFTWLGPHPSVSLMDPALIREVLSTKFGHFQKPSPLPLAKLIISGLVVHEGKKWAMHRRIINPAFHVEKLKLMFPAFTACCTELVSRWGELLSSECSCEIDVWPELQNFSRDVISRTAFGSNFEEGTRIFQLQEEQIELAVQSSHNWLIPGYSYLPTRTNRKLMENFKEISEILRNMIVKREKAIQSGTARNDDLLGLLLESNLAQFETSGSSKSFRMTTEDVIEECKLFYFAGQETTAALLTWAMILLSAHSEWQERARAEVFQVFGRKEPHSEGLSQLKIMTMILYEVLRLYPSAASLTRSTNKTMKLGKYTLPPEVRLVIPVMFIHHDPEFWGEDANAFNPKRFAEGISRASKGQVAFFPFGAGPRVCVGQNFSMIEAKLCLSMFLQRFSFELSPTYAHAPYPSVVLRPQHGAPLILRKL